MMLHPDMEGLPGALPAALPGALPGNHRTTALEYGLMAALISLICVPGLIVAIPRLLRLLDSL